MPKTETVVPFLHIVDPEGGNPSITPEQWALLDEFLVSLDQLRKGPPISDEVQHWAREILCDGLLSKLIAQSQEFRWVERSGYCWMVLAMLGDLAPEVLTHAEIGSVDFGLSIAYDVATFDFVKGASK
jgi:hypothetical protein